MVGNEGMAGVQLVLGLKMSPFRELVQRVGATCRITVRDFSRELDTTAALQQCLQGFGCVVMVQLCSTDACACLHMNVYFRTSLQSSRECPSDVAIPQPMVTTVVTHARARLCDHAPDLMCT
jgi:hypothetical protein